MNLSLHIPAGNPLRFAMFASVDLSLPVPVRAPVLMPVPVPVRVPVLAIAVARYRRRHLILKNVPLPFRSSLPLKHPLALFSVSHESSIHLQIPRRHLSHEQRISSSYRHLHSREQVRVPRHRRVHYTFEQLSLTMVCLFGPYTTAQPCALLGVSLLPRRS